MIYKPKYFGLYELVTRDFFEDHPLNWLWYVFDQRILWTADELRKRYGPMLANTWNWNGQHQYRGIRPADCLVGAEFSQHKYGRALDLEPLEVTAEEIRAEIKTTPWRDEFKHITCIEEGVGWLHFDCRNWDKSRSGLLLVKP